jgi:hypothetical protein
MNRRTFSSSAFGVALTTSDWGQALLGQPPTDTTDEEVTRVLEAMAQVHQSEANPHTNPKSCARELLNMAIIGSVASGKLDLGLFENKTVSVSRLIEAGKLKNPSLYAYFPTLVSAEADKGLNGVAESLAKTTLGTGIGALIVPEAGIAMKLLASWVPEMSAAMVGNLKPWDNLIFNLQDAKFLEDAARVAAVKSRDLVGICPEALKIDLSRNLLALPTPKPGAKPANQLSSKLAACAAKCKAAPATERDGVIRDLQKELAPLIANHFETRRAAKELSDRRQIAKVQSEIKGIGTAAGLIFRAFGEEDAGKRIAGTIHAVGDAVAAIKNFQLDKKMVMTFSGDLMGAAFSLATSLMGFEDATQAALKAISAQLTELSKQVEGVRVLQIETLHYLERQFGKLDGKLGGIGNSLHDLEEELKRFRDEVLGIAKSQQRLELARKIYLLRASWTHKQYDYQLVAQLVVDANQGASTPGINGLSEAESFADLAARVLNDGHLQAINQLGALRSVCELVGVTGLGLPHELFNPKYWAEAVRAYLEVRLAYPTEVEADDAERCRQMFNKGQAWRRSLLKLNASAVEKAVSKWQAITVGATGQPEPRNDFANWVSVVYDEYCERAHYKKYTPTNKEPQFHGPPGSTCWSTDIKYRAGFPFKVTVYWYPRSTPIVVENAPHHELLKRKLVVEQEVWPIRGRALEGDGGYICLDRRRYVFATGPRAGKQLGSDIMVHHVVHESNAFYVWDYNPTEETVNGNGRDPESFFKLCAEELRLNDLVRDIEGFPAFVANKLRENQFQRRRELEGAARSVQLLGGMLLARCEEVESKDSGARLGDIAMPTENDHFVALIRKATVDREEKKGAISMRDSIANVLDHVGKDVIKSLPVPNPDRSIPVIDYTLREIAAYAFVNGWKL